MTLTKLLAATALGTSFWGTSLLVACGPEGTDLSIGGPGGGDPAAHTTPTASADPATPEEVSDDGFIVRIDQGVGGFTTAEVAFARIPTMLVTTDGSLIMPGSQIATYPPPLLPALQGVQLDVEDVQAIEDLAVEHGLLEDFFDDSLRSVVTDVGSTIIRVNVDGTVHTSDVYALGIATDRLPPELAERHRALLAFVAGVQRIVDDAGPAYVMIQPTRYALSTRPVDVPVDPPSNGDVSPTVRPWPAALGDEMAGCAVLDVGPVYDTLRDADRLTYFERSDGSTVKLLLRPMLPGTPGCES